MGAMATHHHALIFLNQHFYLNYVIMLSKVKQNKYE